MGCPSATPIACPLFPWRTAAFLGTGAFFGTWALTKDLTGNPRAGVLGFSGENSLLTLRVNSNSGGLAAIEAVFAREDVSFAGEELFFASKKLFFLGEDFFFFFGGIRRFGWHFNIYA